MAGTINITKFVYIAFMKIYSNLLEKFNYKKYRKINLYEIVCKCNECVIDVKLLKIYIIYMNFVTL